MAYNYYPQTYQIPSYYPTQTNAFQSVGSVGANQSALTWVQGEAGAKSYMVAPNQTVVLWDSEAQTVYLKSADASGMPSIKILDYTIRENGAQKAEILAQKDFATKDDVELLRKEINALKAKYEVRKENRK